ncbi:hypothetical protein AQI95_01930 [Streptomyces yokosukanensis]|uniref:Uncharacterized protein n=1 Tax=Streptomyces yokosukanensis TaxID=67386 RepID=A0A124HHK8_9ACTN|nr:hypothetical protein AQI95_01930 [Streptomyces yokosukanensis]
MLCEAWSDCRARGGWIRIVYDNRRTGLAFRHSGMPDRFPAHANAQDAWEGRTADAALRLTASAIPAAEAHRPAEDVVPRRTTRQDTS